MSFSEFSKQRDLHSSSHRHLTHKLVPRWLRECPEQLDAHIQSAAYGETPPALFADLLGELSPQVQSVLDLGAGAGNLVSQALQSGLSAWGIEQNEALVQKGREYLSSQGLPPERLILGSFLDLEWPSTQALFAASSRFSAFTRQKLAERIETTPKLRLVLSLGQTLDIDGSWEALPSSSHRILWNPSEEARTETLYRWHKLSLAK